MPIDDRTPVVLGVAQLTVRDRFAEEPLGLLEAVAPRRGGRHRCDPGPARPPRRDPSRADDLVDLRRRAPAPRRPTGRRGARHPDLGHRRELGPVTHQPGRGADAGGRARPRADRRRGGAGHAQADPGRGRVPAMELPRPGRPQRDRLPSFGARGRGGAADPRVSDARDRTPGSTRRHDRRASRGPGPAVRADDPTRRRQPVRLVPGGAHPRRDHDRHRGQPHDLASLPQVHERGHGCRHGRGGVDRHEGFGRRARRCRGSPCVPARLGRRHRHLVHRGSGRT